MHRKGTARGLRLRANPDDFMNKLIGFFSLI